MSPRQPSPKPQSDDLPREIDGYTILHVLGTGGMATVYAAMQKHPKRQVALKVVKSGADDRVVLRRFKREVEILGKLRHPYIAQIFDAGTYDDGRGAAPYFVMEYIPAAKTLLEYVAEKELTLRERLKLFVKVCSAVEHGHRNKVIHRDLKPGNILIDRNGEPKIIDFGVARATETEISQQTMTTEAGRLVGTVQYMSPEQLDTNRQDLDARCDVYALGAVLYRLLTGKPAHDLQGLSIYAAMQVIQSESPAPASAHQAELRGDLDTIIAKALAKDRVRRYRNAGSLGRDLIRYLASKPINARSAGPVYRTRLFARRNKPTIIAGSVVIVVLALAAGIVLYPELFPNEPPAPLPAPRAAQDTTEPPPETVFDLGGEAFVLLGQSDAISSLHFDTDGAFLIATSASENVGIWELSNKTSLPPPALFGYEVTHSALSRDGATLAVADTNDRLRIIDSRSGTVVRSLPSDAGVVRAMAVSADGAMLAYAGDDLTLRLLDFDGTARHTMRSSRGVIQCAAFGRTNLVAAGTEGGAVYIRNTTSGEPVHRLRDGSEPILVVGFSERDERVIAITASGLGLGWTIEEEQPVVHRFQACERGVVSAAIDPTGRWLLCATQTTMVLTDLRTLQRIGTPIELNRNVSAAAMHPSGQWVAIGRENGEVEMQRFEPGAAWMKPSEEAPTEERDEQPVTD